MRIVTRAGVLAVTRGLLALGLLYGVCVLPSDPANLSAGWALPLPVEVALIALLMLLLPAALAAIWRVVVASVAALLTVLKLADLGTFSAFNRPFNPLLDTHLPRDGWNILSQSLGTVAALLAVVAALLILALSMVLLAQGLGKLRRWPRALRGALMALALAMIASSVLQASVGHSGLPVIVDAGTSIQIIDRVERIAAAAQDLSTFRGQLAIASEPAVDKQTDTLLHGLDGKDVLLVFVESYGRTVFERPLYADVIKPRLSDFQAQIESAGFHSASGWLTSPTFGGQSWLAHGTLLSGLWVDNQPRYDALVDSDRISLNRLFARAGWRTSAVMPAITREWPEAHWFGYDELFASDDLGYEGQPFNWVTMPDQYTLAAIKRLILDAPAKRPAMIETALISSHAPWTPIPPLLDWAAIGDGHVFDAYATAGDPPEVVWQDYDRVRAQYRKAIDYSLATLASFIATQADDNLVLIILGDHQPAPLVTGDGATRDVPIHIIAHDPAVLKAIDGWHWTPGMTPDQRTPAWPMDAFYQRLIDAFSGS